ncbi:MAG TPA: glycosyltransferase [Blastocatellia bacterium]|nr:glycosyltransferase [Blastocatellia bacterium]
MTARAGRISGFTACDVKVLQVGKFYPPHYGGIETVLHTLCRGLSRHISLRVLVANDAAETTTDVIEGVTVTRVARWGTLAATPICPSFPQALARWEADIYHLHEPNPLATISYLLVKPKGRLVVTFHSDVVRQKILGAAYRLAVHQLLERADRIIVATPHHLACCPVLRSMHRKCVVIPFGVDISKFHREADTERRVERLRARFGDRIVLFVGRLVYYKGVEVLIRAMTQVAGHLLIVGEGPWEKKLRRLARRLSLENKVSFQGEVSSDMLVAYYHACDVFVLPSTHRSEMFGLVQLEAMACGKPVVSTALPTGVSWVNQHNVTGLLVPPGDAVALARAITHLLDDPDRRNRLGEAAQRRVAEEFTADQMIERTLDLYRRLL